MTTDTPPAPLTEAELDAIEARAAAATAGPWSWARFGKPDPEGPDICSASVMDEDMETEHRGIVVTDAGHYPPSQEDGEFIIASRVDVPRMLAEVRRLRAEASRLAYHHHKAGWPVEGDVVVRNPKYAHLTEDPCPDCREHDALRDALR